MRMGDEAVGVVEAELDAEAEIDAVLEVAGDVVLLAVVHPANIKAMIPARESAMSIFFTQVLLFPGTRVALIIASPCPNDSLRRLCSSKPLCRR